MKKQMNDSEVFLVTSLGGLDGFPVVFEGEVFCCRRRWLPLENQKKDWRGPNEVSSRFNPLSFCFLLSFYFFWFLLCCWLNWWWRRRTNGNGWRGLRDEGDDWRVIVREWEEIERDEDGTKSNDEENESPLEGGDWWHYIGVFLFLPILLWLSIC